MANEIEFIRQLVPEFKNITNNDEYLKSRYDIYTNFMKQAEIPAGYLNEGRILKNPLPDSWAMDVENYQDYINDVDDFINFEYNCMFNFTEDSYVKSEELAVYIIQSYIKNYLKSDRPIKRMVYIEADALMTDLKRSIGNGMENDSIGRSYRYKYETLSTGIENYDFVIWNNLMDLKTDYEKDELDSILGTRHQRGLSNLFMVKGTKEEITEHLGKAHKRLRGCSYLDV